MVRNARRPLLNGTHIVSESPSLLYQNRHMFKNPRLGSNFREFPYVTGFFPAIKPPEKTSNFSGFPPLPRSSSRALAGFNCTPPWQPAAFDRWVENCEFTLELGQPQKICLASPCIFLFGGFLTWYPCLIIQVIRH